MSPTPFHAKQEQYEYGTYDHPPLKTTKDSNFIHCLPPPSSTEKTKPVEQQPPPRPLIIYTHSPKVIHTQPRDFMALVQKLTGYTRPLEDTQRAKCQANIDDNESTSVVTEEHGSSVNHDINSCFVEGGVGVAPPPFRLGFDPYFNPTPVFPTNRVDFLCTPSPFYNPDSMFLNRNSLSSSSLRVLKDFRDV
ncbi:VQ motif-containing protein 20-like [Helianthus annuus]|uniref:VQ motif-containing protein 20-like n=1 Tax=Helianthus annuus TaxID=4232 RepID=UPI000B8EF795|nr:VQ motif-containing protein 20-like [Helianthus annuus]